jgi:hypothetical protein
MLKAQETVMVLKTSEPQFLTQMASLCIGEELAPQSSLRSSRSGNRKDPSAAIEYPWQFSSGQDGHRFLSRKLFLEFRRLVTLKEIDGSLGMVTMYVQKAARRLGLNKL